MPRGDKKREAHRPSPIAVQFAEDKGRGGGRGRAEQAALKQVFSTPCSMSSPIDQSPTKTETAVGSPGLTVGQETPQSGGGRVDC
eukprot:gene4206-6286_t